jgi:acetyltransferase-like isoleucine patch superfamily enzyme
MPIDDLQLIKNCDIGEDTTVWNFVNLYGCEIGSECMIGAFVEIQSDVEIGDGVRIQSHSFVCSKTRIGDDVFVGHGVVFINDRYPPREDPNDWSEVIINDGARIGSNATLFPVEIGECAVVGAGSVVTEDVPDGAIVVGNPAEVVGAVDQYEQL